MENRWSEMCIGLSLNNLKDVVKQRCRKIQYLESKEVKPCYLPGSVNIVADIISCHTPEIKKD